MNKVFGEAFPGNPTVVYGKTYLQPNEQPLDLYLTSDGKFWKEDVVNTPGFYTQIGNLIAGAYAQSVTAFGREYIATSDGLHGSGVPLQFDGTNLDRVSQDGPGAAPSVSDESATYNITASAGGLIPAASLSVLTVSQVGNLVTLTYTRSETLPYPSAEATGVQAKILQFKVTGVGTGYDGTWVVASLSFNGGFTIGTATYVASVSGLSPLGAGGTIQYGIAEVVLTVAQPYDGVTDPGKTGVTIAGAGVTDYDGTWTILAVGLTGGTHLIFVNLPVFGLAASGGGTLFTAGSISVGTHQVVQMFLTRQGYLTAPSPVATWSATGGRRAIVTNLAIGPANTQARVLGLTGAGGDNFFTILANVTTPSQSGGSPSITQALVIPDNTTSQVTIDFADNTLFAATAIDIPGNNLFAQLVLGPCLGVFSYASRMFWWGEYNKIQNLINMGFEGGSLSSAPTAPLGWTVDPTFGPGGTLVNGGSWASGQAWQITGDGVTTQQGMLTQPCYQDANGIAILAPSTQYTARLWAKRTGTAAGSITVELVGTGAIATIPAASISTAGGFVSAVFSAETPSGIPTTAVLRVYGTSLGAGEVVTLDEIEIVYTSQPYLDSLFRISYVNNPEAFDGVTGSLGPTSDPHPIRGPFVVRDVMNFLTSARLHQTTDNGTTEPSGWSVTQVADNCGAIGWRCISTQEDENGEDWAVWGSQTGLRIFEGGTPWKISQEIQPDWDTINKSAQQTAWICNDNVLRRIYVGLPTGAATAPNQIFPLDYRELDKADQIASAGSIHISFTGKMIASDLARKWTIWNLSTNFGAIMFRPGGYQFVLGAGNGQAPGAASGFGNVYTLSTTKFTDDDYGQMFPDYYTYMFVPHEMEQALGVGSHNKLGKTFTMYISGLGFVTVTPFVDSLTNFWPSSPAIEMLANPLADVAIGMNVTGERMGFKISVAPITNVKDPRYTNGTDVQFNLQKMILTFIQHPWAPMQAGGGI